MGKKCVQAVVYTRTKLCTVFGYAHFGYSQNLHVYNNRFLRSLLHPLLHILKNKVFICINTVFSTLSTTPTTTTFLYKNKKPVIIVM